MHSRLSYPLHFQPKHDSHAHYFSCPFPFTSSPWGSCIGPGAICFKQASKATHPSPNLHTPLKESLSLSPLPFLLPLSPLSFHGNSNRLCQIPTAFNQLGDCRRSVGFRRARQSKFRLLPLIGNDRNPSTSVGSD